LTLSQGKLIRKNFDIENETNVAEKPLVLPIYNISITNNVLEIRFYWAGKGTTRIPDVGVYGLLVSAFSVVSSEYYPPLQDECKFILLNLKCFTIMLLLSTAAYTNTTATIKKRMLLKKENLMK